MGFWQISKTVADAATDIKLMNVQLEDVKKDIRELRLNQERLERVCANLQAKVETLIPVAEASARAEVKLVIAQFISQAGKHLPPEP